MENLRYNVIKVAIIIFLICVLLYIYYAIHTQINTEGTVIKIINEKTIIFYSKVEGLKEVTFFFKPNFELKEKQYIRIFWNGNLTTDPYPGYIKNVYNTKLILNESTHEIPDSILREYFNKPEYTTITIDEFNTNHLQVTVTDNNDIHYNYFQDLSIYDGKNYIVNILPNLENNIITSSKDDNVTVKPYTETFIIDLSSFFENQNNSVAGSYQLKSIISKNYVYCINFKINEKNELTYDKPYISNN